MNQSEVIPVGCLLKKSSNLCCSQGSDRARRDAVAMAEALGPMKERGAMRGALNPGAMRELAETYPRELVPTETYILGSFGSAWGGMKVHNATNYQSS